MTFIRETRYKIDAERDGKPMTGYGKDGRTPESRDCHDGFRVVLEP